MKLVILDYENSQVRIINNCPTNWNSENIEDLEDYMFDGEHLNRHHQTNFANLHQRFPYL